MSEEVIRMQFNIVICVKCEEQFQFNPGQARDIQTMKDDKDKALSQEAKNHYSNYRFKCYKCKTEQCRMCKADPYHKGYTCDNFKKLKNSKTCRYCGSVISKVHHGVKSFEDVCADKECVDKLKYASTQMLGCGHPSCGTKFEN